MTPNQPDMTANQQEMAPLPLKQQTEFDRLLQEVKNRKSTLTLQSPKMDAEQLKIFLEALKAKSSIHTLEIYNGNFDDQGLQTIAEFIKRNKTIKNLILINTESRCGDAEAVAFADALKVNKTLKKLDLSYSCAQEQGIGKIGKMAFGEVLRYKNRTLEVLDLDEHPPSEVGDWAIANALLAGNNTLKRYGKEPEEPMFTIWRQTAQNRRAAAALQKLTDPADRLESKNNTSSTSSTAVTAVPMTFAAPGHTERRTPVTPTPVPFIGVSQARFTTPPTATDAKKTAHTAPVPKAPFKRKLAVDEKSGKPQSRDRNNNQVSTIQKRAVKKLRRTSTL